MNITHCFAAVGEALNFIGAGLLAYDVLSKPRIQTSKRIARLFDKRSHDRLEILLPAIAEPVVIGGNSNPSEEIDELHLIDISRTTKVGLVALAGGCILLVGYHLLELVG